MKISTETDAASSYLGERKAVELIAGAGFDAWDFSMFGMTGYDYKTQTFSETAHPLSGSNRLRFARELRHIGNECGIECNQSHAPFPSIMPQIRDWLLRAIECTAEAGGKICVIHPDNNGSPEQNAEMYNELLPFAKQCGVRIATENMFNWSRELGHSVFAACATPESFNAHLDAVNDDYLVACLDIGHAEMLGSDTCAVEMVEKLGPRLQALHIHDNDKLNDSHQLPFSMSIDFPPIINALKKVGYPGFFTLECDNYISSHRGERIAEDLRDMRSAAKRLAEMFVNL